LFRIYFNVAEGSPGKSAIIGFGQDLGYPCPEIVGAIGRGLPSAYLLYVLPFRLPVPALLNSVSLCLAAGPSVSI